MDTMELNGIVNQAACPQLREVRKLDIQSLIDLIVTRYHVHVRHQVPLIYELANNVFIKSNGDHPQLARLVESLFLFFDDLLYQIKKEEQILFPNIIQLAEKKLHEGAFNYSTFGIIKEYALVMRREHLASFEQLQLFRRLTNSYSAPEDACESHKRLLTVMKAFDEELVQHISLESNVLIPRAIEAENGNDQ